MKTATIPSLRVSPKLRDAATSVLQEGETLSSFVEQSIRENIERRVMQQAFIERGLLSRDDAQKTAEYYSADEVMDELKTMLTQAKQAS